MDYKIIEKNDHSLYRAKIDLEEDVNSSIKNGYKPCGGVSVTTEQNGYEIYYTVIQAMVKE